MEFDIKLSPINDPTMSVEWFLNDQALTNGSRFHVQNDFGLCVLSVRGVIAEDAGKYSIVARNELGEDRRECQLTVESKEGVVQDSHHEESLGKIEYLEGLNRYAREEVVDAEVVVSIQLI